MAERAAPLRILQLTDTHLLEAPDGRLLDVDTAASLGAVLDAAAAELVPDLVLVTGDLVHDGSPAGYRRLRELIGARFEAPIRWTAGNHDVPETLAAESVEELAEAAFVDDAWAVLALSTHVPGWEGGRLGSERLARLAALLERHRERHVLLALHHPPVPVGAPWLDAMALEDAPRLERTLAYHANVRAIVCGHVHQAVEGRLGGAAVLTTPSTCFQFAPGSERFALDDAPPGWRWIDLHPDGRVEASVRRLPARPGGAA